MYNVPFLALINYLKYNKLVKTLSFHQTYCIVYIQSYIVSILAPYGIHRVIFLVSLNYALNPTSSSTVYPELYC